MSYKLFLVEAIGEEGGIKHFFFTKPNFAFYIEALSINYKPVFTELKSLF